MRRLIALLAAGALLLTGCGTSTTTGSGAGADAAGGGTVSAEPTPTPPGTAGEGATSHPLDFTATALDGSTFDASTLRGTPTVIWFWAPWCPTCRAQIPTVTRLAEKYDGQVEFLGAGGLDGAAAIRDLADDIPHVTHLVDDEGKIWKRFGVTAQSTYEVVDANGEVVSSGYLDDGALEDLVAELAG